MIKMMYKGELEPPKKQTKESAGLDLFNNENSEVIIYPNESAVISTGVCVEIPKGFVGLVFARSSLGFKYDCTLANSVGVIDSDYRGEIKVKITNHSAKGFEGIKSIEYGERVAQLVILPICNEEYELVGSLSETERGEDGFGSTGKI